jgi:hypothetical protein
MTKLYEEFDETTQRRKVWTRDGDNIVQRTSQDVQPLLDANLAQRNDRDQTRHGIKKGFWKVGSIPLELAQKWKTEEGFDIMSPNVSTAELLKRLRMAEYEKLRTTDAKF